MIPVIMITGVEDMASVTRCIEAGAEDYLTKPYDPLILQSRVHAFLDTRRLRELENMYQRSLAALTQAIADLELGQYESQSLTSLLNRSDALGSLARAFDRHATSAAKTGSVPHGLSVSDTRLLPKRPPA
jgi:PleD family two-component response regulator